VDDVLHEGKEVAIVCYRGKDGKQSTSESAQAKGYDGADDQDKNARPLEWITKAAWQASEESDLIGAVKPHLNGRDLDAALAASFALHVGDGASGHAQFTEKAAALVAIITCRRLGVELAL